MQSANISYEMREGTVDLGTEYEVNMLAVISLRYLHHTKEDFWLATNVKDVGAFDDIVLRIGQNTFMLQLKHKDNLDLINENQFFRQYKSGFYLQRYVNDIHNLQHTLNNSNTGIIKQLLGNFDKIYFLLYTNKDTYEYDFLKQHTVSGYLSYLNSKVDSKTYEIANVDNFYLFCNQINATEARHKITEEVEKLIGKKHLDDVCEGYIKFITEWRKGILGKPFCLTRNVIVSKLTELLFKFYEIELLDEPYGFYQCQQKIIWNKIIQDKIITVIDCKKDERIFRFLMEYIGSELEKYCNIAKKDSWSNNLSELEQRSFYDKGDSIHRNMLKAIKNQYEVGLYHIYKCLWKEGRIPLVLVIYQDDQYEQIIKALELPGFYYRVIIVNKSEKELTLKDSMSHFENLQNLSSEHKEDILQQQIKFQGRSGAKLKDLVDETMFAKIKTADIVNILLNNYNIGKELESVPTYYIPRRFQNLTSEDDLHSNLTTVISAGPGMGKSVLMNHIAQQTTTDKWVIRIDLRKYNEYYQKLKYEYKSSSIKSLEYLNHFREDLLESGLETEIFQKFFKNKNVVVLMDGFDEISISYREEVTNIAKSFHDDELPLCLTTRPVEKSHLEETFNVVALELPSFNFEDQKRFLQVYFSADKEFSISIEQIEKLLNSCNSDVNYSFTSTPLHIQLIAELCKMQKGIDFKENFDRVYLYRTFMEKKREILFHKYGSTKSYDLYNNYQPLLALGLLFPHLNQQVSKLMNQYVLYDSRYIRLLEEGGILTGNGNFVHYTFAEFLAAEWLSKNINNKDENVRNIVEYVYKICTGLDYTGLIIQFQSSFLFYIFNRLLIDDADDFSKSICLSILNKKLKEVVQIARSASMSLNNAIDKANRSVLQLIILCGREHSTSLKDALSLRDTFSVIVDKTSEVYTDVFGYSPIDYAISYRLYSWANTMCKKWPSLQINVCVDIPHSSNCFDLQNSPLWQYLLPYYVYRDLMLKNVSEHGTVNGYIKNFFRNPELFVNKDISITKLPNLKLYTKMNLCYEVVFGTIDSVKKVLETHDTIINMRDSNGYAPLHYAAFYGKTEIIKILLSKNANSNITSTIHGLIPLQCSIICGQLKAFRELLNESSVNARDTSLHYAVAFKHLEMIELLLSKGPNVNSQGPGGTALNLVAKHSEQIVLDYNSCILPHRSIMRVIDEEEKSCRILEKLLSKGADINAKRWIDGKTPIHDSVHYGNSKVVQNFIQNGADVNAVDNSGNTVLHFALRPDKKAYLEIIDLLLSKGADVYAKNSDGHIPLHYGVKCDSHKIVDKLISYGTDTVNVQDKAGNTPLHHVMINCRDLNIVQLLFLRNANVNIKNIKGDVPLHVIIKNHRYDCFHAVKCDKDLINIIELLLQKGTKVNTKTIELLNYTTAENFVLDKVDLNSRNNHGNTPLHEAILRGHCSIIKLLLSSGANTDIKNSKGETPLHFAINYGDYKAIEDIIQHKPEVNVQDKVGDTPLHTAITSRGCLDSIRLLLSNGANTNIKNMKGESPFHLAVKYEIARYFLRYPINARNNIENTSPDTEMNHVLPSWKVIVEGQIFTIFKSNDPDTITNLLLRNGADANITNLNKETPLHICIKHGHYEGVKELIDKGVNVNAKDIAGNTPLHYTKMFDVTPDVKDLLLSNGADVSLKNREGKTFTFHKS